MFQSPCGGVILNVQFVSWSSPIMFQYSCGGVTLNVSVCVMEFFDNSVSLLWSYLV